MMDKVKKYLTEYRKANSKYPELDKIALKLARQVGTMINKEVKNVESEMPYKAQYVLEELIRHLEEAV